MGHNSDFGENGLVGRFFRASFCSSEQFRARNLGVILGSERGNNGEKLKS